MIECGEYRGGHKFGKWTRTEELIRCGYETKEVTNCLYSDGECIVSSSSVQRDYQEKAFYKNGQP